MHIHYQSKIQAKKALSKNGKILGNNIMVGVSHCIDKVSSHKLVAVSGFPVSQCHRYSMLLTGNLEKIWLHWSKFCGDNYLL